MTENNNVADTALKYLINGFSLIPMYAQKSPQGEIEKKPCLPEWKPYQSKPPSAEQVTEWWRKSPKRMIGLVTGEISKVIVLDTDTEQATQRLNEYLPESLTIPTAQSPGGFFHYYFKYQKNLSFNDKAIPDCHFRGEGGLIIAPPSDNGHGGVYRWLPGLSIFENEPPELPQAVLEKLFRQNGNEAKPPGWKDEILEGVSEGQRNDALTRLAGSYVAKGLPEREIFNLLLGTNLAFNPPLPEKEVKTILESVIKTHQRNHPGEEQKQGGEKFDFDAVVCGVDNFRSLDIPEKKKILNPWISEQDIILISGWRGTGKTWLGVSIFDAISKGEPFGPWETINPVACLYLDGEMPAADAKERLQQLADSTKGVRKSEFAYYSDSHAASLGLPRTNILNPEWREKFKTYLVTRGFKLLALDNMSSLAAGIDENSKLDWDPINQWFISLRFAGISVVFFHHTGKSGEQRGTSAREDNIDCSVILDRPHDYAPEQGARFIVKFGKNRVRMKDLKLLTDIEMTLQEIDGVLRWTYAVVKESNKILILKKFDEGIRQSDIVTELKVDKSLVSRIKNDALRDGFLTPGLKLTHKGITIVASSSGAWK